MKIGSEITVEKNVSDPVNDILRKVLVDYSKLPEYSELGVPDVNTVSLFGDYPIHIAATRGNINEILSLVSAGANVNVKGEHGYTPLHDAVEQGHIESVKLLLKLGSDKELKNEDGDTPLNLAILLDEKEIQRILQKL